MQYLPFPFPSYCGTLKIIANEIPIFSLVEELVMHMRYLTVVEAVSSFSILSN